MRTQHKTEVVDAVVVRKVGTEVAIPPTALQRLQQLADDAREIQKQAREEGDLRCALLAIGQLAKIIESIAKLSGEALLSRAREVEPDIRLPDLDPSVMAQIRSSILAEHSSPPTGSPSHPIEPIRPQRGTGRLPS